MLKKKQSGRPEKNSIIASILYLEETEAPGTTQLVVCQWFTEECSRDNYSRKYQNIWAETAFKPQIITRVQFRICMNDSFMIHPKDFSPSKYKMCGRLRVFITQCLNVDACREHAHSDHSCVSRQIWVTETLQIHVRRLPGLHAQMDKMLKLRRMWDLHTHLPTAEIEAVDWFDRVVMMKLGGKHFPSDVISLLLGPSTHFLSKQNKSPEMAEMSKKCCLEFIFLLKFIHFVNRGCTESIWSVFFLEMFALERYTTGGSKRPIPPSCLCLASVASL